MSWTDIPSWSLDASKSIMEAVRMKDAETFYHCVRVSRGSRLLAKAAGLNELDQKIAEFAGLFHDIGKIGIPDSILNKPARLTPEEMDVMKDHPEMSVQILEPLAHLDFFYRLLPGVRHHHEWYDGRGYPHGVKGDQIPLSARLVLIADTFDAITADRVYRKGRPPEAAYKELFDWAGTQFDPYLVKIYLEAQPTWSAKDNEIFKDMNHLVLKTAA
jgi:putative nucleotidyltransferase with HDIG domain